jgi:hypothetical protein
MMNIIKSLYVPKDCLQGSEFPAYIIYNRDFKGKIQILFPESVEIKEMYNVGEGDYELRQNELIIEKTEVSGYVGAIFKAKKNEKHALSERIKFVITHNNIHEEIDREILLFRPEVCVSKKPERVIIKEIDGNFSTGDKITVSNEGSGTGILVITVDGNSEVKKKRPDEMEEFVKRFWGELDSRLSEVKEEFSEYSGIIEKLIELWKIPSELDKEYMISDEEYMSKTKNAFDNLSEAISNDEDFGYAFAEAFVGAYMVSVNIITEVNSFLNYLNSIADERMILFDAIDVLELKPGVQKFIAEMRVTDLANNSYPPIDVSTELMLDAEKGIKIPVYSIFEWGTRGK